MNVQPMQQSGETEPMPKELDETLQPDKLPDHWYAAAIVLLIDERVCSSCGRRYRVPNKSLMVRLESCWPGLYRSILRERARVAQTLDIGDLLYEHRTHVTYVERCEACFPAEPEHQIPLFPRRVVIRPNWKELLARKREEALREQAQARVRDIERHNRRAGVPKKKVSKIAQILADL